MASYERLDYGSPDGSQWGGASSDALGMYGVTPATRYVDVPAAASFNVSTSTFGTNSTFGWLTGADMSTMVATVSSMRQALARIGLIV